MLLRLVCCTLNLTNVVQSLIASPCLSHMELWFLNLTFQGWLLLLNGFYELWNPWQPMNLNVFEHTSWECQRGEQEILFWIDRGGISGGICMSGGSEHLGESKVISYFEGFKSMSPADSPLCWWTGFTWLFHSQCNTIVLSLSGISLAVGDIWHLIKMNVMQLNFQITFANFWNVAVISNIKLGPNK